MLFMARLKFKGHIFKDSDVCCVFRSVRLGSAQLEFRSARLGLSMFFVSCSVFCFWFSSSVRIELGPVLVCVRIRSARLSLIRFEFGSVFQLY
jgi:hypothetical protein